MINRLFPSWQVLNTLNQSLTDGEVSIINYLDQHLPKDENYKGDNWDDYKGWLIFVQPFLNGSRPDVVIFNPSVGIQIIEVKDWNLDYYRVAKLNSGRKEWYVTSGPEEYIIKSPQRQVDYYKNKIIEQLIPKLGEEIDSNSKLWSLVKTSLYFHCAPTSKVEGFFDAGELQFSPTFGKDYLTVEKLHLIVPDCRRNNSVWNKEWNKDILFWLRPPWHSIEQAIKINLNTQQKKFSDPQAGHHRIRGVAGSGKTQVLAIRAGKLASEGKRVLVLSYNITLWHYIKDMVARSPFEFSWGQLAFNHFHGFCKDLLNEYGEKWPTDERVEENVEIVFKEVVPKKVLDLLNRVQAPKYDAILIDEGQDFHVEWYQVLNQCLTSRDELVVVCDKKQNIYNRELDWLDKRRPGMEKFGNWIELLTIVRLPERIANVTREFSEAFNLNQEVRIGTVERPDLFNQFIDHSLWWNIAEQNWLDQINEAFNIVKNENTDGHVSDIVILVPDKHFGMKCVDFFEHNRQIRTNHVFENSSEKQKHRLKKAFWLGDSRLKISTIHSFKGWEILNVILFIPERLPKNNEINDRIVYTAITRTRQNLIVINANQRYAKFGEKFPKQW